MVRGWRSGADVGSVVGGVVIVVVVVRELLENCRFELEGVAVEDIGELL